MPISFKKEEKYTDTDGAERQALVFTFTNGAKDQILDLKDHFKQTSELELIKLAISVLQKIKEQPEALF